MMVARWVIKVSQPAGCSHSQQISLKNLPQTTGLASQAFISPMREIASLYH